jgi:hypothetical protein
VAYIVRTPIFYHNILLMEVTPNTAAREPINTASNVAMKILRSSVYSTINIIALGLSIRFMHYVA